MDLVYENGLTIDVLMLKSDAVNEGLKITISW